MRMSKEEFTARMLEEQKTRKEAKAKKEAKIYDEYQYIKITEAKRRRNKRKKW